jgi:hypothetical protein
LSVELCSGPSCGPEQRRQALQRYYELGGATPAQAACLANDQETIFTGPVPVPELHCGMTKEQLDSVIAKAIAYVRLHPNAVMVPAVSTAGFRTEKYRGVEVSVPRGLMPIRRTSGVSTCDVLARAGVYLGGQLTPGKCAIAVSPEFLSVTLSPLDGYTAILSAHVSSRSAIAKVVESRQVVVAVWFGTRRRDDAVHILASVRPA